MNAPKNPVLLLDADVICHQMAYASTTKVDWDGDGTVDELVRPEQMKVRIESFCLELIDRFKASKLIVALSARGDQWRKQLWPAYKATRRPKPALWEQARAYLEGGQLGYGVACWPRLEGDDVLGILHTGAFAGRSIMVSIDKDMRTVPGWLYLFNKPDLGVIPITPEEADLFHLQQTISGDPTDEYKGVDGFGEKRAVEWLNNPQFLEWFDGDRWKMVLAAYHGKGQTSEDALMNARLARILRAGEYNHETHKVKLWNPKSAT